MRDCVLLRARLTGPPLAPVLAMLAICARRRRVAEFGASGSVSAAARTGDAGDATASAAGAGEWGDSSVAAPSASGGAGGGAAARAERTWLRRERRMGSESAMSCKCGNNWEKMQVVPKQYPAIPTRDLDFVADGATLCSLFHTLFRRLMSDAESASVLHAVLRDLKARRLRGEPHAVSDTHAQLLAALPVAQLALLQRASELVARKLTRTDEKSTNKRVKRVTAQPSGRHFFRVESLSRYTPAAETPGHLLTPASQPFDGALRGPHFYNVLVPHYCSCQSFHEHSVPQSPLALASPAFGGSVVVLKHQSGG